jgi:hypothetical protein
MDDLWRLRLRRDGFLLPDAGSQTGGAPAFLGLVVSTGANLGVGKFMLVNPVDVTGAEVESGAAGLTVDTSVTVLVDAIGPAAPATGDYVVCRHVNFRWVADKQTVGGGGGGTVGFTVCCPSNAVPTTVTLSFTFGSPGSIATYNHQCINTTLTYMTTLPAYAAGGVNRYFSPTFVDDFGSTDFYSIACNSAGGIELGFANGTAIPSFCCFLGQTKVCSPFLLDGIVGGTSCFGDNSGSILGNRAGDNITVS